MAICDSKHKLLITTVSTKYLQNYLNLIIQPNSVINTFSQKMLALFNKHDEKHQSTWFKILRQNV